MSVLEQQKPKCHWNETIFFSWQKIMICPSWESNSATQIETFCCDWREMVSFQWKLDFCCPRTLMWGSQMQTNILQSNWYGTAAGVRNGQLTNERTGPCAIDVDLEDEFRLSPPHLTFVYIKLLLKNSQSGKCVLYLSLYAHFVWILKKIRVSFCSKTWRDGNKPMPYLKSARKTA